MIFQKLMNIAKTPSIKNSWLAQNGVMRFFFKLYLKIFNTLAINTKFFGKNIRGSCGKNNTIHPSASIETNEVIIGNACVIKSKAVIHKNSKIGNNVTIGSGTIVGSEGYEVRRMGKELIPVAHVGGVIIHDYVVIGSKVCIDKALFSEDTEILENSRIDNFTHVAHGVKIGKRCYIGASVMIGGKVIIGDDVVIEPRAVITDQIVIGEKAHISMGAVVTKEVLPNQRVTGNFAIDHKKFLKFFNELE
jgi:UDP-3-O-[3-hydroxymyristoyl] glucosamine N-acyltransferase